MSSRTGLSQEARMRILTFDPGDAARASGRTGESTTRILSTSALILIVCASLSALARAQAPAASRDARSALNRNQTMTGLNTVDLPLTTPANVATTVDSSIRPFHAN